MSKFTIGDRVQANGEPTDWNIGTIERYFDAELSEVRFDSTGLTKMLDGELYLVCAAADRPAFAAPRPKHAAFPQLPDHYRVDAATLTPKDALNLASKLLQFATQRGTK